MNVYTVQQSYLTVYRCLHGITPPYLSDGLQRVAELNRRRLRSSMSNVLVVPPTKLVTVGDRASPVAGSIDRELVFYKFFSFLKFNEFYDFFG